MIQNILAYPASNCHPLYMDLPNLCVSLSPDGGLGDHTNAVQSCRINGGTMAQLDLSDGYYNTGNANNTV